MRNVTVVGVYRTDVPNNLEHLQRAFAGCDQRWREVDGPKFPTINSMLRHVQDRDYVLVCDDDITVPDGFLEKYLVHVDAFDLALAQPARTLESTFDHAITRQRPMSVVRETRFVEIGPLFSVRRGLFRDLFPFDESSPMGWGYDLVWPVRVAKAGLKMGIVDETPVAHSLRPSKSYDVKAQQAAMEMFLATHKHLPYAEATRG